MDNVGGDDALYRRMLGLFRDHETDFVQRFRAAHAAGDATTAMRAAHDLKSEAGTLGMRALEEAAAALRKVSSILNEVVDELRAIVGAPAP